MGSRSAWTGFATADEQIQFLKNLQRLLTEKQNSIALAMRDREAWKHLVRDVKEVVRTTPLWKLQMVGGMELNFLYENRQRGRSIELRPGVAYCLQKCNSEKADHLAAAEHLSKWAERNTRFGSQLEDETDGIEIAHDSSASTGIARWAYENAVAAGV